MSFVNTYNAFQIDNLTAGQKAVLTAIATFERNGKAWPSVATLAKRASMGVRTVQRHLAALINLGYITRTYRAGKAAVTRLFIGQTPAKLAGEGMPNWHPEPGIPESVNQIPAVHEPATPEHQHQHTTVTATADIVVFTENEQPITPQALTKEMPDVFATDSMVTVSEVTGCHPQAGMPVKASTAPLEPPQEVPATDTLADVPAQAVEADPLAEVPATLLADLGEVRKNKKRPAKPTKTEAALWWAEAQKAGWTMQQVITTMILHGWARFQADWVQHVPPQTAPGTPAAPKVWQPEPHTPASASTLAQMKERIAQMKERWAVEATAAPMRQ